MVRSHRIPATLELNAWAQKLADRRAAGDALLDLTESNPTHTGLPGLGAAELGALADPHAAWYEPAPRGMVGARAAVAAYYSERRGVGADQAKVEAENILLTSGTSESYAHLFRLFADPGDQILVPSPSYPLFAPIASLEGAGVVPYRLAYDGAWHVDIHSVEAALASSAGRARAVVVVQPNHPTGTCLSGEEIAALENLCEKHSLALISDEVFSDFPWPPRHEPLPSLLGERRVPTFVLGGLSKSCGMPQLKLGWIAACGPERATREALEGLEWIADLFLSVGTPVQLGLTQLLETRHDFQARVRDRLATNLTALDAFARDRGNVDRLRGEGGWSAILRMPSSRTGEEWALHLLERDVVVHPGHFYDIEGESYLVVSLITEPGIFRRGLDQLQT